LLCEFETQIITFMIYRIKFFLVLKNYISIKLVLLEK
jgi:hypothetical protein